MRTCVAIVLALGCNNDKPPPPPPPRAPAISLDARIRQSLQQAEHPPMLEAVECPPVEAKSRFECIATHTATAQVLTIEGKRARWSAAPRRYRDFVEVSIDDDRVSAEMLRLPRKFWATGPMSPVARDAFVDKIDSIMRAETLEPERVECPEIVNSRPATCTVMLRGQSRQLVIWVTEDVHARTVDGGWKKQSACTSPDPMDPARCYLDENSFDRVGVMDMKIWSDVTTKN